MTPPQISIELDQAHIPRGVLRRYGQPLQPGESGGLGPTAGFGVRYKSPVGPIRVDIGFKLDRQRFDTIGRRESSSDVHISIGQACW